MIEPIDLGIPGLANIERIGAGGNAIVYRARQTELDRDVVIKVLLSADVETTRRRFDRERRAMGRLSQARGIAPLYGSGFTPNDQPYLLMPFYELGSLQEWLESRGPLPVEQVQDIGGTIARAVQTAHENGVLHRDLKPANILMSRTGQPDVADFGIAHLLDDALGTSQALTMTPLYTAPEVFDGIESGAASDIYSIGATLYALLNGTPAFGDPSGGTPMLSLMRRINQDPLPPLPDTVPTELSAIIEKAMSKDPSERQTTAGELAAQLAAVDLTSTPAASAAARSNRSRRFGIAAAVAALAVVAALVAFLVLRGGGETAADVTPTVEAATAAPSPVPTPTSSEAPTPAATAVVAGPFDVDAAAAAAQSALVRVEAYSCRGVEIAQGVLLNDGTILTTSDVLQSPWHIDVLVNGEVRQAEPETSDANSSFGWIRIDPTGLQELAGVNATEGDRVAIVGVDGVPAEATITIAENSGLLRAVVADPGAGNPIEPGDVVVTDTGGLVGVVSVQDNVIEVVTPQELETTWTPTSPDFGCPRGVQRDLSGNDIESAVSPVIRELLTMQRLMDAYAGEDWAVVREIEPAKLSYDQTAFVDGWRPLRRAFIYPVSRQAEDDGSGLWRLGLVGIETWAGSDLTTLFCVSWSVDDASGTVNQTPDGGLPSDPVYGSQPGQEQLPGALDPGELRPEILERC